MIVFLLPRQLDTVRANALPSAAALAVVFALSWMRSRSGAGQHAQALEIVRALAE